MATGQLEMTGTAEVEGDGSAPAKGAATFGFTPAQQIMFQSSNMNGQRVVMVTPEVARSLGIVSSEEGAESAAETAIQIKEEDSADISVSVLDTEEDGMIDPDQFLAMELASGKAEAVVDEDLTSLSWLHSKQLLKASDVQFRSGSAAAEGTPGTAAATRRGPMSAAPLLVEETAVSEFSQESPTSDYLEELPEAPAAPAAPAPAPAQVPAPITVVRAAAAGRSGNNGDCPVQTVGTFNFGKVKRHPPHLPYDPKIHVHFKPPFSFSCLIFMSIEDSPCKAMPVKEIYNWIQEHFPFYQAAPIGWKNSVRHNLSLNKCFRKVEKSPGPGKGSLWTVDPLFRPHLIQALKRSPCVQETPAGATSRTVVRPWSAAASALGGQPLPLGTSPRRTAGRRPAAAAAPPPPLAAEATDGALSLIDLTDDPRSTESLEEAAAAAAVPAQTATAVPRMTPRRRPSRGAKRTPSGQSRSQSDESGPNPDLFPLLSRRLQSGGSSPAGYQGGATSAAGAPAAMDDGSGDGEPQLMIVQEPPPPETPPARCRAKVVKRARESTGFDYDPVLVPTQRVQPVHFVPQPAAASSTGSRLHPRVVVIRRSPEEEHTYARDPLRRQSSPQRQAHHPHSQPHPLLSDDEAFSDDSNLSIHDMSGRTGGATAGGGSSGLSPEEAGIRFVQEGADLLLNLAGVSSGPPRTVTIRRGAGRPPGRGRGRGRGAAAVGGALR